MPSELRSETLLETQAVTEDARRLACFRRTGTGVPWTEVRAWMESWGKTCEVPIPKPRRL